MTAAPDAVELEDRVPHVAAVQAADPDDSVQVTPSLLLSLVTVAVNVNVLPAGTEAVVGVIATTMGTGAAVTVMVATADFVVSATDVAVSVTVVAAVTLAGAV